MRGSKKNGERGEQVRKNKKRPSRIELLHPQTKGEMIREPIARIKERFGDILQNLSDLIWEVDENCVFTWCSGAAKDIYGVAAEELVGGRLFDLMPAEEAQRIKNIIEEIFLKKETIKDLEAYHKDKQGRRHWLCVNGIPTLDNKGTLKGYIGVCKDITSRKKTEESLRESELKFRTLTDEAFDGIAIHDGQRIIEVNKAFGILWGYTPGEAAGLRNAKLFAPECWGTVKKNIQSGYDKPYETVAIRKDGTRFPIEVAGKSIIYEGRTMRIATTRDITDRKQAEEELRKERDRTQKYLDVAGVMLVAVDAEQRVGLINKKGCEILGYSEEEVIAKNWFDNFLPEKVRGQVRAVFEKIVSGELDSLEYYENPILTKNGDRRLIAWHNTILRDDKGQVIATLSSGEDITERKKAEEILKRERDNLSGIFEVMNDGVYIVDQQYDIQYINRVLQEEYGPWKGIKCYTYFHDRTEICPWCPNQKVFAGETVRWEWYSEKNGKTYDLIDTPMKGPDGSILKLEIFRDITERKQAEQKLLEDQAQLKSLASQLTLAEEHERHRLATELHDRISQALVISKMKLDTLRKSGRSRKLDKAMEDICNSIGQTIQDTRTLTLDLGNPVLYELGFEAAVSEWLTDRIQKKHGITVEFEDDGEPKPLDDDVRILLFRDVRELLTNVAKHASAHKVKVSIRKVGSEVHIRVEDDGWGFDTKKVAATAVREGGFGLFSIRERLGQLGGHLEIESGPGCGTKATLIAPLKQEKVNRKGKK